MRARLTGYVRRDGIRHAPGEVLEDLAEAELRHLVAAGAAEELPEEPALAPEPAPEPVPEPVPEPEEARNPEAPGPDISREISGEPGSGSGLEGLSFRELRRLARERGLEGYGKLDRAELIELLGEG